MAVTQQYICDGCGVHKGAANHWWTLSVARDLMQIRTWRTGVVEPGALHFCGERCLQRAISVRLNRDGFVADGATMPTCVHCNGVDVVNNCTACYGPTCQTCRNYRCTRIEPVVSGLPQRIEELDSRDIDWEVGAR